MEKNKKNNGYKNNYREKNNGYAAFLAMREKKNKTVHQQTSYSPFHPAGTAKRTE